MHQQLNLFDSLSEGRDVEFKSARGGLPASLWETYSAFANTAGGVIYLGIKETDDGLEIQGLDAPDRVLRDFWSAINNRQKVNENLLTERDVELVNLEGRQVIAISVPRASREYRPVYVGLDPYQGTYRRDHEGDFRCRRGEVQRMFADQTDAAAADGRILVYFGLDDFDEQSLRQFRNRMESRQPNHPWLLLEDVELLTRLGGWRRDRPGDVEGPTVAGLLMFGKTQSITDTEALPGFHVDYRERLAADESVRWSDRLTVDGTWEANLFQFYIRVVQKIHNDNALKIPFERDAEGYRKGETAVHEALQEALVNALIHADHTGQGGIIVDRFPNRFEFSNPGTLLLSLEQLVVGGVSECRNKSLQKMFQMLGAGDKAGSGLDKIRSSWQAQHWQSPSLREAFRPDRVILSMPLVSMLPSETVDALKADFGQAAIADLIDDEIHTLVTAAAEGRVTNRRLQEMLTRHRVDITQMLGSLVERGVLERHERGRGTYYTIAWRGEGAKACAPDHSPMPTSEALARDVSSVHKDVSSVHKDVSSVHKDVSSVHKEPSTLGSQRAITPPEVLAEQLAEIAEPVHQTQRATPALVEATILALCAVDYLSLQRLGTLLNRNPTRLRTRYIKPLLQTGQLALRYPDKPNHRQQAYRTVEPSDP